MAARTDPIRVVEAAYTWEPDERRWLDGLVAAASRFDVGGGTIALTVEAGAATRVTALASMKAAEEHARAVRAVTESLPLALAHRVLAPTEFVGNSEYRMTRLARGTEGRERTLIRECDRALPAMWALVSGEPTRRSLMLCFPRRTQESGASHEPFPHRDGRSLGLIGAHLGAALRLRTALAPCADDPETEAVLRSDGKLLHATGDACTSRARESLVDAVLASERARGRMRREAPDDALRAWTALVRGRWTIIDSTERDGRRYLLARRNPLHHGNSILELTPDERDVAWLAALGHSFKYIAYELGIPLSTAASRLRRAMRKLGVRSRKELLKKLGTAPPGQK
ncbi:helix-turn-helix transcriptional regulator [Pyxidicoccus xibeiensis]|uniref:helix-turn-helix transcriptional regulator n=1 Tax=Pyxidicoccus xibeiensis TaxID=2906759 RepID=UPI0020A7B3F4|nr:LuxR C-terminal-related transcriptional regulator [Pyxidicoccus xibeiensis]MCP3139764.1 LuxR C-terminal-related transcriptional regulator [Pyxidicoccus xibeiensis]